MGKEQNTKKETKKEPAKTMKEKRLRSEPKKKTRKDKCHKAMSSPQPNNPLHAVTLEMMLVRLQEKYGWERMGRKIKIQCFLSEPSIKSSLVFLRKTPWARKKVEDWYVRSFVTIWKEG